MIQLSAGTPPPPSIEPRRPLTLHELEEMHGLDPDDVDIRSEQIPGVPAAVPWARLAFVAAACGVVGFALPLLASGLGLDVSALWTMIDRLL